MLAIYAGRLAACELNATTYRQPTDDTVRGWAETVPPHFRFSVKAHRNGSLRAYRSDPSAIFEWLCRPYRLLGGRLGTVLFRLPDDARPDLGRLDALLGAWPDDLPLTLEFRDPDWLRDEVLDRLRSVRVALCTTELDESPEPPRLFLTGDYLYLRLRRASYTAAELDAWAARIRPFLEDGRDVYAFFRHDETGRATVLAADLRTRLGL